MTGPDGIEARPAAAERGWRLRDGSEVVVRPIEPGDKEELRAAYEHLSDASRHQRFIAPPRHLSDAELVYFTDVDHRDHEALVAREAETQRGIGVARFVRLADRPDAAEVAVTVADEWQGRGVGTLLVELLSDRAREEGIRRFVAFLLAENREALALIEPVPGVRRTAGADGTIELEVILPPAGTGETLAELMRRAASSRVRVAPSGPRT